MDIETDAIISVDSYDKFGLSDRRRVSHERVQDFLTRGLLTQDAVLERYTQALSDNLATNATNGDDAVSSIKQAFHQLKDPETGYISKESFGNVVKGKLSGGQGTGVSQLFDILTWHAAFPFPQSSHPACNVPAVVDEDGFLRAVCLLTRNPPPRYAPRFPTAVHRLYSGSWGHHDGWLVAARGKDGRDLRRRLFRSLAVLVEPELDEVSRSTTTASPPTTTTIPVPRFIMYQPRGGNNTPQPSGEEEAGEDDEQPGQQQVIVMADEKEQTIDIQDVLAECPPEQDALTANPLRESYDGLVVDDSLLPPQPHDLARLHIPKAELVALLRLLLHASASGGQQQQQDQNRGGEEDTAAAAAAAELTALAERLDGGDDDEQPLYIDWASFDAMLSSSQTEHVANSLSSIISVFQAPLGGQN
ncbi:hypothetical protein B0H63DRAFT_141522 [Podospora didyma]|uniref:Uncharacterized protein n=1 Tax=Podospora didyma TaxID=330526 RepID=A0AAE0NSG0_9PEZI|nr:hypothetical protein B0H63DRAFT_141522 [Podospora didyma]